MTAESLDIRICFIGDSFVNGTGDRTYMGWTGRLCTAAAERGYPVTHYNLGVRRETSRDILKRWQQEVECRLPSQHEGRLVFSFGVNDATVENGKPRVELAESLENTRQILQIASQRYPVLMIGPPPVADDDHNSRITTLSEQFRHLCSELDVPYLDILTPLRRSVTWMQEVKAGDGAHPDSAGYAELARIVRSWSAWVNWFERRSGSEIESLSPKKPRLSARALIVREEHVLVIEYQDELGIWYALPGGGQQYGEDLLTCLKREVFEETGFTIKVGRVRFIREFISRNHIVNSITSKDFHSVEITFECEIDREQPPELGENLDPGQVGWKWIELDQLNHRRFYPRKLIGLLQFGSESPVYVGDAN